MQAFEPGGEVGVLALLRDGGEPYGFDLVRQLAAVDELVTSEGTIYPSRTRLRREGLVETTRRESRQGPPQHYYRITPSGKEALASFAEQWTRFRSAVDRLLGMGGDG